MLTVATVSFIVAALVFARWDFVRGGRWAGIAGAFAILLACAVAGLLL